MSRYTTGIRSTLLQSLDPLIKHYNAHYTDTDMIPLEKRGLRLLNEACLNTAIETLLFLLDTHPSLGSLHYETPILSAATSLSYMPRDFHFEDLEIRAQLAREEELMDRLLDISSESLLTSIMIC